MGGAEGETQNNKKWGLHGGAAREKAAQAAPVARQKKRENVLKRKGLKLPAGPIRGNKN